MTSPQRDTGAALGFTALAIAGLVWGTGFIFSKWALEDLGVSHMVLLRFAFATLAFLPVLWWEARHAGIRVKRADLPLFLISALLGVPIQFLVQVEGLARTTVSHASLMVGALPVLLAAAAALFAHERLNPIGWFGLLISTTGAGLVALGGSGTSTSHATLMGDLLVIISLFAGVAWILLSQRLIKRGYSPGFVSTLTTIAGTLMLAAWVLTTAGLPPLSHMSVRTWESVIAVGVFATTMTTLLWNWGLLHVSASQAGVFINLEPLVGTALGYALFGDRVGALGLVGGALIIGSAVAVARKT